MCIWIRYCRTCTPHYKDNSMSSTTLPSSIWYNRQCVNVNHDNGMRKIQANLLTTDQSYFVPRSYYRAFVMCLSSFQGAPYELFALFVFQAYVWREKTGETKRERERDWRKHAQMRAHTRDIQISPSSRWTAIAGRLLLDGYCLLGCVRMVSISSA